MIKKISSILSNPERDFVYRLLPGGTSALFVDVGAAAGESTSRMKEIGGPECQIVAFEPFPPNHRFFAERTRGLAGVKLVPCAVSHKVGEADFYVGSTVKGTEPGWENYRGYSSVGALPHTNFQLIKQKIKARLLSTGQHVRVPTTTLDREFPNETIEFLKMDVQGAENLVLRGAHRLMSEKRVHLLYLEWSGDPEVEELLDRHGYCIYDTNYVGSAKNGSTTPFEELGFEVQGMLGLSTGFEALELAYRGAESELARAVRALNGRADTWIQTDLLAFRGQDTDAVLARLRSLAGDAS